jgi:hypothetical protein
MPKINKTIPAIAVHNTFSLLLTTVSIVYTTHFLTKFKPNGKRSKNGISYFAFVRLFFTKHF